MQGAIQRAPSLSPQFFFSVSHFESLMLFFLFSLHLPLSVYSPFLSIPPCLPVSLLLFQPLSEQLCFRCCQNQFQTKTRHKCKMLWMDWGWVVVGGGVKHITRRQETNSRGQRGSSGGSGCLEQSLLQLFFCFDWSCFGFPSLLFQCAKYFRCSLKKQTHHFALQGRIADGKMLHSSLSSLTLPLIFSILFPIPNESRELIRKM